VTVAGKAPQEHDSRVVGEHTSEISASSLTEGVPLKQAK